MIRKTRSRAAVEEPLVAGAVHGVRAWTFEGERILGLMPGPPWEPGGEATRARCLSGGRHTPPGPDCGCGLHGFHPWSPLAWRALEAVKEEDGPQHVAGIVEAWGNLEIHADGFRAEQARPVAFFLPATAGPGHTAGVYGLAGAYEARVVELSDGLDLPRAVAELAPDALDQPFVEGLMRAGWAEPPKATLPERLSAAADLLAFAVGIALILAIWGLVAYEAISLLADLL